jgi:hypothetical protein
MPRKNRARGRLSRSNETTGASSKAQESSPSASQPSLSSVGQYFLMQQQPTSTSCERSYRFPIVFPFSIRFIISTAGDSGPIDVVYYRGSRPRVDTLHHHGQRDKKNAVGMGMTQRRLPCFSLGRGCLKKLYLFYLAQFLGIRRLCTRGYGDGNNFFIQNPSSRV